MNRKELAALVLVQSMIVVPFLMRGAPVDLALKAAGAIIAGSLIGYGVVLLIRGPGKDWWQLRKYRKSVRGVEKATAARQALNGPDSLTSKTTEAVTRPGRNPPSRRNEESN